ncbi:MAG: LysR substrate-binding domain-containing protein, partial [Burkholderiaceae bacterium]
AARSAAQISPGQVSGTVRITSTDTIMHGLIAPALTQLITSHPQLTFDLHTGNELASLTRRDADIAVRATRRPPQHLIGKHVGPVRVALFGAKKGGPKTFSAEVAAYTAWAAPDDALPEHPSVVWRKKHFPKVTPTYRVGSILTVSELVGQGAAIGLLPMFLAENRGDLRQLTDVLDECQTELWLLTHTDTRHLRRVSAVYSFLSENLQLS